MASRRTVVYLLLAATLAGWIAWTEQAARVELRDAVDEAARVVATALWNLDREGPRAYLEEVVEGDTVREVLSFVQFDPDAIRRTLRREVETALASKRITLREAVSMRRFLDEGLEGYTYLE